MTKITSRDQFQVGTIYRSRCGIGNGSAVQTYKVTTAPYFNPEYGDNGEWLMACCRWVKKTQKFSGNSYIQYPEYIIENDPDTHIVEAP